MFAVPGWSVSATQLKEQKIQPGAKPPQEANDGDQSQRNDDGGNAKKGNNKRKRGRDKDPMKVTKSNVDEMWRRHIEGATPGAENKNGAMSNKKRKMEKGKKVSANNTPLGVRKATKAEENDRMNASTSTPAKPDTSDKPQKKNKNKKQKAQKENNSQDGNEQVTKKKNAAPAPAAAVPAMPPPPPATSTLTPLQQAMRQKLLSARFRHLNETLYTTPSERAMELFTENPEFFQQYHAGFSHQVKESWPSNPVDSYISTVRTRGATKPNNKGQTKPGADPLPRRPHGTCTIADMGCGDAQFARALIPSAKKLNLKLLSFDLCESDQVITKADIASLPVEDGSVDVTIFCLSLMGTNWVSFVEEAWRVLRGDGKGECWVSEVKSRFGKVTRKQKPAAAGGKKDKAKKKRKNPDDGDEEGVGEEIFAEDARTSANDGDETDISAFVEVFRTRGFVLKQESVDKSNKMFVKMEFVKTRGMPPSKGKYAVTGTTKFGKKFLERENAGAGLSPEEESKVLKPCVYKIR